MRYALVVFAMLFSLTNVSSGASASTQESPVKAGRLNASASATASWAATSTLGFPLPTSGDVGIMQSKAALHVVVALRGNRSGADALLRHIYRKGDPLYHHFLTPPQFTALFAPSATAAFSVAAYLASSGMRNVRIKSNRLLVTADTTVGAASQAFNTEIHGVNLGGRSFFVNVKPAQVPASLGGIVQSVLGLDSIQMQTFSQRASTSVHTAVFARDSKRVNRRGKARRDDAQPQQCNNLGSVIAEEIGSSLPANVPAAPVTFCYPAVFAPNAYAEAYDDQNEVAGYSTTIADFSEGATNLPYGHGSLTDVISDLSQMEVANGISSVPVTIVQVGSQGNDISEQAQWDVDSQASVGIAGGIYKYYFYNGSDLSLASFDESLSQFATDNLASLGNVSFGDCEATVSLEGGLASTDMILAESALQGQTITAASGQSGSQCPYPAGQNGLPAGIPSVWYPASSPYTLAVGGTSLLANSADGTYYSEVTWCNVLSCGGGSGISYFEQQSSWQSLLESSLTGPNAVPAPRLVPDVAMAADPYTGLIAYITGQPEMGWGGTGLASALAEGVYARLQTQDGDTLGNAAAFLYPNYVAAGGGLGVGSTTGATIAAGFSPPAPNGMTPAVIAGLNDVFLGSNTLYQAAPGFDLNTGMGSLNINGVFAAYFGSYPQAPLLPPPTPTVPVSTSPPVIASPSPVATLPGRVIEPASSVAEEMTSLSISTDFYMPNDSDLQAGVVAPGDPTAWISRGVRLDTVVGANTQASAFVELGDFAGNFGTAVASQPWNGHYFSWLGSDGAYGEMEAGADFPSGYHQFNVAASSPGWDIVIDGTPVGYVQDPPLSPAPETDAFIETGNAANDSYAGGTTVGFLQYQDPSGNYNFWTSATESNIAYPAASASFDPSSYNVTFSSAIATASSTARRGAMMQSETRSNPRRVGQLGAQIIPHYNLPANDGLRTLFTSGRASALRGLSVAGGDGRVSQLQLTRFGDVALARGIRSFEIAPGRLVWSATIDCPGGVQTNIGRFSGHARVLNVVDAATGRLLGFEVFGTLDRPSGRVNSPHR